MRLRFSLRTLFVLTTLVAVLCLWFMLPSLTARRFLAALNKEDYKSADKFFRIADDRFLVDWSEKRWWLRVCPQLLPLSFSQCWHNERTMRLEITYFQFDQSMKSDVLITATPFGVKNPEFTSAQATGFLYDMQRD